MPRVESVVEKLGVSHICTEKVDPKPKQTEAHRSYPVNETFEGLRRFYKDLNVIFDIYLKLGQDAMSDTSDGILAFERIMGKSGLGPEQAMAVLKSVIDESFGYKGRLCNKTEYENRLHDPTSMEFGFWIQYCANHTQCEVLDFVDGTLLSHDLVVNFIKLFFK